MQCWSKLKRTKEILTQSKCKKKKITENIEMHHTVLWHMLCDVFCVAGEFEIPSLILLSVIYKKLIGSASFRVHTPQIPKGAEPLYQWLEKDITLIYININLFICLTQAGHLLKVICILCLVKLNYHWSSTIEISPMSEFIEMLMHRTVS